MREYLFTSESVTEGHPDKVCDRIADSVLDDILSHDERARVACEVCVNTGMAFVFGEVTTEHYCDVAGLTLEDAQAYYESRERLGFPMAPREWVAQIEKKTA